MKRILFVFAISCSVLAFAGNGDDNNEAIKLEGNSPKEEVGEFPNPILKLWKFFFRDYNNVSQKLKTTRKSDTTFVQPKRYYPQ